MDKSDIKIEKSEVLRYLGHRGQAVDEATEKMLSECSEQIITAARPRFIYRIFGVSELSGGVALSDTDIILRGDSIKSHLSGCKKCAVMAATLGIEVDRLIAESEHVSMTRAVILDACATDCIEKVCDAAENEIKDIARKEGLGTKFRFSAGYGDLPIEHQTELIAVLNASKQIGLTVTADNILIPRKSVTAIIGFSDFCDGSPENKCDICENRDVCEFRR